MAAVIRCTACTAEYAPDQVPQTCTRCGTSGGWCQINQPDQFSELADAIMSDVQRVTGETEAAREAMNAAASEQARERMLGEEKAPGVCSQIGCDEQATHRFTWPGNPERFACPLHASAAVRVAQAMGFFLEVPALVVDDAPPTPRDMPEVPHG